MKRSIAFVCLLMLLTCPACRTVRLLSLYESTKAHVGHALPAPVIEIPFAYEHDWITIRMEVLQDTTRLEGDFLFDTGAFTRLFDSIPGINVRRPERVAPMPVRGFLGTTYWQLSIAPQVALRAGGFSVLKPNLLTGSRPAFFPAHWLGIIGADYFHRHVLTIDFERRRLLVYADGAFRPDSMARLPLKTIARHNPILSKLRLGNMPPDDYLLDVGNNGQVMLQHRDEAGLRQAMGADVLVYAIQQRGLQDATGNAVLSDYFVRTMDGINGSPSPAFEVAGLVNGDRRRPQGNLGLAFLRQVFASCTIDLSGGWLYYRLNERPGEAGQFGREVYFRQEDSAFITGPVLISSTWYRQGLRPEMQILLINDQSPSAYIADRKLGRKPALQSIRFKAGDTLRTITLKN